MTHDEVINRRENTMTLCLENTLLTIADLESHIKTQLEDPQYSDVQTDPLLDIILHAQQRLAKGDFQQRVISEAMVSCDEYLLCSSNYELCDV